MYYLSLDPPAASSAYPQVLYIVVLVPPNHTSLVGSTSRRCEEIMEALAATSTATITGQMDAIQSNPATADG
jgi:acetylglutamate synthase